MLSTAAHLPLNYCFYFLNMDLPISDKSNQYLCSSTNTASVFAK